ncbi:MAG TPA: hypothetical protein VFS20_13395 [Longimicrobium sp.]|nr:hypothetical protein [Longimicrobium sp.]
MHTEHLTNVRPGMVGFGWFISAAITSLIVIGLIAVGVLGRDGLGGTGWGLLAIAAGFFAGGWYVGMRTGRAPILHAVAMGLFSLLLWLLLNLVPGELLGADSWNVGAAYGAGLILLQIAAAAVGGRIASRDARAGAVEPS